MVGHILSFFCSIFSFSLSFLPTLPHLVPLCHFGACFLLHYILIVTSNHLVFVEFSMPNFHCVSGMTASRSVCTLNLTLLTHKFPPSISTKWFLESFGFCFVQTSRSGPANGARDKPHPQGAEKPQPRAQRAVSASLSSSAARASHAFCGSERAELLFRVLVGCWWRNLARTLYLLSLPSSTITLASSPGYSCCSVTSTSSGEGSSPTRRLSPVTAR